MSGINWGIVLRLVKEEYNPKVEKLSPFDFIVLCAGYMEASEYIRDTAYIERYGRLPIYPFRR